MGLFLSILNIPGRATAQTRLDDKVLDGQMHQRWLICKGSSAELILDSVPSPAHCYKWFRRDQPGQSFTLLPDDDSRITVFPIRTIWYRCERYLRTSPSQCAGTPDKILYFKVYVIEEPDLASVQFNGEWIYKRDQGIIGQPETMDEYITYYIDGGPTVYHMDDLDPMEIKKLQVNIHFTTSNNQFTSTLTKAPGSDLQFYITQKEAPIPQVIQDGISKEYELNIRLEHCGMFSPEAKIKVKRLWIEEFKTPFSQENWNIVLGENIKFKALATNNCTNFHWSFLSKWGQPLNNGSKEGNNMYIDANSGSLKPIENKDFGKQHGIVVLKCKYKNMELSVSSSIFFKQNPKIVPVIDILGMRFMAYEKKAVMFFNKDDQYISNLPEPNWFIYWKNGPCAYELDKFDLIVFDPFIDSYAKTHFRFRFNDHPFTKLTLYALASKYNDIVPEAKGVHCFNTVIWHELEHIKIKRNFWPNGYIGSNDKDRDGYPDDWEATVGKTIIPPFDPDKNNSSSKGGDGVGSIYEEEYAEKKKKKNFMMAHATISIRRIGAMTGLNYIKESNRNKPEILNR